MYSSMNAMLEQRCQTIFPQVVFLYMATPTFIFLLRMFFHSKIMAPLSLAAKDRKEVRLCPVAENHGVRFDEAMGHHEATPIEDGVAVDGDTPPARIAGEETDEVEVVVANHVDGGLRCLHRDIELITPGSPT